MQKSNRFIDSLLAFFLMISCAVLISINCGGITNTGNPSAIVRQSQRLAGAMCLKLFACEPEGTFVEPNACTNGILAVDGIDVPLGLQSTQFDSYQEIVNAEATGALVAIFPDSEDCVDAVENLDCDSSEVVNAFDSSQPDDFTNVSQLVNGPTCDNFFDEST